ncbi:unnamed protein product [Mytilus edulis]|uniref:Uncharacterized protein n=1 Tax=Mytilus edulis TaxID=6550 RepID=A0A8S3SHW2_MYTED|nr:unnamed protein product [Mytilus edulis]
MLFNVCLLVFVCAIFAEVIGSFIYRYPSDVDLKEVYDLTENFQNANQRRILEKQLLYCPMVPLCNNLTRQDSYPNGTSSDVESCCYSCSCQEKGLGTNGNCPNSEITLSTPVKTCIYPQYLPYAGSFEPFDNLTASGNVLKEISHSDDCNIFFQGLDPISDLEQCDWGIYTTCNQTGNWGAYDKAIEDACTSYTSVYLAKYRNVFCFLCNSNEIPFMGCKFIDLGKKRGIRTGTFVGLISFMDDEQKRTDKNCGNDEVFDAYEDKCREVVCPSMHYFNKKKQQCEEIFQKIRKRTYVAYFKVTIIDEKLDEDDCSMSCVSDDSFTVEYGICSYIEITLSGIDCCYLLEYHYPKDIKNVTHREYIVGISLYAFSSHNQRTYVEVLSSPFEVNRQKM